MNIEELITALRGLKVETGSIACMGCGYEHNCGVHGCAIMRSVADRLEELGQRVHRWIPVDERLPDDDDGDWCLVYADGQEGYLVCRGGVVCAGYDLATGNSYDGSLVRYWMPMPEPPEEEL